MGCMVQSSKWSKRNWTAEVCDLLRDPQTPVLEPLVSTTQKNNRWQEEKAVPWGQRLREGGYIYFSFFQGLILSHSTGWTSESLYSSTKITGVQLRNEH